MYDTATVNYLNAGREKPQHYYGPILDLIDNGWVQTIGRNRDSDLLTNSNFDTVISDLKDSSFEENADYMIEGSKHWAVGWVDVLMVRGLTCKCDDGEVHETPTSKYYANAPQTYTYEEGWERSHFAKAPDTPTGWRCITCGSPAEIRPVFEFLMEYVNRLENYPVLDEDDYMRREREDLEEFLGNCYSILSDDMEECCTYLYDTHSVTRSEEVSNSMIDDWKLQKYGPEDDDDEPDYDADARFNEPAQTEHDDSL